MLSRRIVLGSLAGASALVVGWGVLPPRQRLTGSTPLPVVAGQAGACRRLSAGLP